MSVAGIFSQQPFTSASAREKFSTAGALNSGAFLLAAVFQKFRAI